MEAQTGTPLASAPLSKDDKLWGLLAQVGPLVGGSVTCGALGFVFPLAILLTKGKESAYVRAQAVESLNFQIGVTLALLVGLGITFVTFGVGVCVPIAILIASLVVEIQGAMKAANGEQHRCPLTIRFIK